MKTNTHAKLGAAVGPTVNDLKTKFSPGSIPLDSDFANLIDVADCGRKAAGLSPDITPVGNTGLVLEETTGQLKILPDPDKGLEVTDGGIGLIPEQQFVLGMIMMFSGSAAPNGWAFCDGGNGTPDLRSRFVLGAPGFDSVNVTNTRTLTGDNDNKHCNVNTDSQAPSISVTVNDTTLTTAQLPPHSHGILTAGNEGNDGQALYERDGKNPSTKKTFSASEGSGKPHTHAASASQSGHTHSVDIVPPYYMLAFIMKQ